ncbi:MAG TPA: biotin transporter BioY [Chloroflexota bacterium]|nr:biotin transporter BioY [Chloroflexota bacterium]
MDKAAAALGRLRIALPWSGVVAPALTCTFFALLVAVCARIAVPLPFTPVPFTLQPLAVALAGLLLGSRLGSLALLEYVLIGFAGAPVFEGGTGGLLYPASTGTLGYLLAYPAAAWIIGRIAERSSGRFVALLLAGLAGLALVYTGGVAYLVVWLALGKHAPAGSLFTTAVVGGVMPFALFDLAKIALAALVARPRPTGRARGARPSL